MCSITGILSLSDQEPDRQWLDKMSYRLRHRGPDGRGSHFWTKCGLSHERLSIIDVAGGRQPLLNEDGQCGTVVNGEIYNYRELKTDLQRKGHIFSTQSDSEVILHGYEEEGPGFFKKLDGMFALAIWDNKAQKLILARDGLGKKPLAYARFGNSFAFASEISAFREIPGFDTTLSSEAIQHYLRFRCVGQPLSIYEKVRKVPPGCWVEIHARDGSSHEESFWKLPEPHEIKITFDEAKEEVRRLIRRAVEKRLMSEVPLGVMLSGGIDSSIVAYETAQLNPHIETFTIGFDSANDETAIATRTAKLLKLTHTVSRVSMGRDLTRDSKPEAVTALVDMIAKFYDEPFADSSAGPTILVSSTARRCVTVALNGDGGDEAMAGYGHYRLFLGSLQEEQNPWRKISPFVLRMAKLLPRKLRTSFRAEWDPVLLAEKYPERFARWTSLHQVFSGREAAQISGATFTREKAPHPFAAEEAAVHDYEHYLSNQLLVKMDRATMACQLEARSPFLDNELIAFTRSLPLEWKVTPQGLGKRLLREAYHDRLPDHIWEQPKRGFQSPVKEWLRGPLRERLNLLQEPDARLWSHLDHQLGEAEISRFLSGAGNEQRVWSLLMLDEWLKTT